MPILSTDLTIKKSSKVGGAPSNNGGEMSFNAVQDLVKNNMLPDVTQAEKSSGSTLVRKFFLHNTNAITPLINARVFVDTPSTGDDAVYLHAADQSGTESGLSGSERLYGTGVLSMAATAGSTTISVLVEDAANAIFVEGDVLRLSNKPEVTAAGLTEDVTIATGGVGTPTANVIVLNLTVAIANSYILGDKVSSCIISSSVEATVTTPTITSIAGTLANPPTVYNASTTSESWVLTFTSNADFNILGSVSGSVGVGTIAGGVTPTNTVVGQPFLSMNAADFGGTYAIGDMISFVTTASNIPFWVKRIVPLGAASLTANSFSIAIEGEG